MNGTKMPKNQLVATSINTQDYNIKINPATHTALIPTIFGAPALIGIEVIVPFAVTTLASAVVVEVLNPLVVNFASVADAVSVSVDCVGSGRNTVVDDAARPCPLEHCDV